MHGEASEWHLANQRIQRIKGQGRGARVHPWMFGKTEWMQKGVGGASGTARGIAKVEEWQQMLDFRSSSVENHRQFGRCSPSCHKPCEASRGNQPKIRSFRFVSKHETKNEARRMCIDDCPSTAS